jgi:hypothetical protein
MAWFTASNALIPATHKHMVSAMARPTYTERITLIVFVLLRLDAGAFFMSVLIIRVEVKNTHA